MITIHFPIDKIDRWVITQNSTVHFTICAFGNVIDKPNENIALRKLADMFEPQIYVSSSGIIGYFSDPELLAFFLLLETTDDI
jgi:hypothetical protein